MILRIVKLKIWLIVMQLMDTVAEKGHSRNIFPKSTNVFQIDNFFSNQKIFFNPSMEIKIQKIKFLKNQSSIFSFFKFWNMDLNVIFHFFEIQTLISFWVSIKIEAKFEFMGFDCNVKELLSGCQMFVLYYVWSYSMTATLNDDSSTNKMGCWKMDCWNVSKESIWL